MLILHFTMAFWQRVGYKPANTYIQAMNRPNEMAIESESAKVTHKQSHRYSLTHTLTVYTVRVNAGAVWIANGKTGVSDFCTDLLAEPFELLLWLCIKWYRWRVRIFAQEITVQRCPIRLYEHWTHTHTRIHARFRISVKSSVSSPNQLQFQFIGIFGIWVVLCVSLCQPSCTFCIDSCVISDYIFWLIVLFGSETGAAPVIRATVVSSSPSSLPPSPNNGTRRNGNAKERRVAHFAHFPRWFDVICCGSGSCFYVFTVDLWLRNHFDNILCVCAGLKRLPWYYLHCVIWCVIWQFPKR